MKSFVLMLIVALSVSCAASTLQKGDRFSAMWIMGSQPSYIKVGVYEAMDLYIANPHVKDVHNAAGLLVENGIVVKDLNDFQMHQIMADVRDANKNTGNTRFQ